MRKTLIHPFLVFLFGLALVAGARDAASAMLDLPIRSSAQRQSEPSYAGERIVLRLRPEVAHAAYAEFAREPDPARRAALRSLRLESLSARLAGAHLEPEFPGETPGSTPDLTTFWIARIAGHVDLASALDLARDADEVIEASPIHLMPIEDLTLTNTTPALSGDASRAIGDRLNAAAPNDSMFGISYWMYQASRKDIHALEAWDVTTGDSTALIAVIDTGVLPYHPDLSGTTPGDWGNLWTNPAERFGLPGVDDDGNGYVDDVWGWDFVNIDSASYARPGEDWRDEDNDPNDFAVHGTAVSGIIAAFANNGSGTCGIAPRARIMALRVGYSAAINPAGIVDLSAAARAIVYAVRNGATVINCSFASDQQPDLLQAVNLATASGVVVVAAAGNNGSHHYLGDREDVISVNSTDQNDKITLFSTRQAWVDLCAPGQSIATTTLHATGTDSLGRRQPSYSNAEAGTSFSSPMVAAAVAMLQLDRRNHGLPPLVPYVAQLRVTETTDNISSFNPGSGYGTGRLNVERVLTDPPASTAFPAGAETIGPGVVLPTLSGAPWVAYVASDSALLVLHAIQGDTLVFVRLGSRPTGGLAAANLGPGLGVGLFVALADGRIAGFRTDGSALPGWPVDATTTSGELETMPVLGDLDGDGRIEVVWGGDDGSVWAWRVDGSRVPGFPRRAGTSGRNLRLAVGDLDPAPGLEIVATSNNFSVYAFRGDGSSLDHWPVVVGNTPTSPVLMRLGSNPEPVVVLAAGTDILAYGVDGTQRFRKSLPGGSVISQDLTAGDLNGDGRDEIVAISQAPDYIASFDSTGTVMNSRLLFVHPWSSALIGPLDRGTGAQVLFTSPDTQGRSKMTAYGPTFADLRGWPKAGHPSRSGALADVDGDGATEVAAGAGADGLLYLYDAGPLTWRPGVARWPTARANFARTGSRLESPVLLPGDDLGPAAITSLHVDPPVTRRLVLRWIAPADAGPNPRVVAYQIRGAEMPLDAANFAAAPLLPQVLVPGVPGAPESLVVQLPEGRHFWFAIRSRDESANWSPISNVIDVLTPTERPAAIADLRVTAGGDTTLALAWTASGDDGLVGRPAYYRIRYSTTPMDSAAFAAATLGRDVPATQPAGGEEQATIGPLVRGQRYWIAMRAVDPAGNASALSNAIDPVAGRLALRTGIALAPSRNPASLPMAIEWRNDAAAGEASSITIYDLSGRQLWFQSLSTESSGLFSWDGRTTRGATVRPGVYFLRLRSGPYETVRRVVLLR